MSVAHAITALFASFFCGISALEAQSTTSGGSSTETMVVGLFDAPPFAEAFTKPDGKVIWEGSSIRLLESIADELQMQVAYRSGTEAEILDALAAGEIDFCASPIAPTTVNMRRFQFSHAYAAVGIAAATRVNSSVESDFQLVLAALAAPSRSHLYGISLVALCIFAILVWLVERRKGGHFEPHPWRGIGASLWWSIVTLATVGYGDKVPVSFAGRFIACAWMLASLILTSLITATIVGALTMRTQGNGTVHSAADLLHVRVAAVRSSIAADWLSTLNARFLQTKTLEDALQLLERERVDAVVAPELPLAQEIRGHAELQMVPTRFAEEYLCFGIAPKFDTAFVHRFNVALVDAIPRLARSEFPRSAPALVEPPSQLPPPTEPTP